MVDCIVDEMMTVLVGGLELKCLWSNIYFEKQNYQHVQCVCLKKVQKCSATARDVRLWNELKSSFHFQNTPLMLHKSWQKKENPSLLQWYLSYWNTYLASNVIRVWLSQTFFVNKYLEKLDMEIFTNTRYDCSCQLFSYFLVESSKVGINTKNYPQYQAKKVQQN